MMLAINREAQRCCVIIVFCACKDAVGDRVTVAFNDGSSIRVAVPCTPSSPLPGALLEALHAALPAPVWRNLQTAYLTSPGEVCCASM